MTSSVAVILLAGGQGKRMGTSLPKQYLELGGKPIGLYSFERFIEIPEVDEVIIVCAEEYQHYFEQVEVSTRLTFAKPGKRRQDSVFNGMEASQSDPEFFCIHDAARPFVSEALTRRVLAAAFQCGAAAPGVSVTYTIKETDIDQFVVHTPDRSQLWEIQTPQVVRADLLRKGFAYANRHQITVTDDVSLAELIDRKVKIVKGETANLKVTTQEDRHTAERILEALYADASRGS